MDPVHADQHTLTIRRILPVSRQEVFDAWTTAESVRQWMCPESASIPLAELDPRVGGAFRVDMSGEMGRVAHRGVYREVSPPERLVFTWISENTHYQETLVTVELLERGEETTELILTQTLLPGEEVARDHAEGWGEIADHLAVYLRSRGDTAHDGNADG